MDDWVFRRDLIDADRLRELSARSDALGALQAASHFLAIGATGYALGLTYGTPWCVPVFVLHGMLLNYLYAAQHELIHRTAFKTRWLNDLVRQATGLLVIYPSGFDQKRHFQHHRYTKDVERDSELQNRIPLAFGLYVKRIVGVHYWFNRIGLLVSHACGRVDEFYLSDDAKREVIREAHLYWAVYALVAAASVGFESWAAVWYWLLPLLLTKSTHQWHNLSEHSGLPNVPDIRDSTRTVHTWRPMRWLAWNMCYHADYHLFPGVPFHALPRLHQAVGGQLKAVAPGYFALHRELFRRVWRERSAAAATVAP